MNDASTIQRDLDAVFRELAGKYAVDVPNHWRLRRTAERPLGGTGVSPVPGRCTSETPVPPGRERARGDAIEPLTLLPGCSLLKGEAAGAYMPLLPWRSERRFVELRRLVEGQTVEPVVMCRFGCLTAGEPMDLDAILYREFDLAEWLVGSPIATLHAAVASDRAANVVLKLANGVACSVEAGTTLPPDTRPAILDRHELIARRGVASDRVVDTQVPQSSIYTFTAQGSEQYTDTDAELFGLEADEIVLVRSAFELARQPDGQAALHSQHERLVRLARLAHESDRTRQCLALEGGST